MTEYSATLTPVFQALADPTRRSVIERLAGGPAATTDLAEPFVMTLQSFSQHLNVLEECGLVQSEKRGRVRTYRLVPRTLRDAEDWMTGQRRRWEQRLDQLDEHLLRNKEQDH